MTQTANVTPKRNKISNVAKEQVEKQLKADHEKDSVMVRGKFIFHEVPGGSLGFVFRKYKWDPIEKYEMRDGEVYSVPLKVAKHLNTACAYPTYTFKNDEQGRPVTTIGEKVRRCSFQSLEFVDESNKA
jgi:hypothetical protein